MMRKTRPKISAPVLAFLATLVPLAVLRPQAAAPTPAAHSRAVINQYCVMCHNSKVRTAGLALDEPDISNPAANARIWEKVIGKLEANSMPPAGMPRPDKATYQMVGAYLETALDHAAAEHPRPGRVAVHRLNRAEYDNAVRDLLDVEVNQEPLLPPDDSGYGFDNIADVLSTSPMLLERYMLAAGKVVRIALGDSSVRPSVDTYNVSPYLVQDERMNEDLPFGSRGGVAIQHNFPADAEYTIKIDLQRGGNSHDEDILGLAEPHQLDVRLDGLRVQSFTVGGKEPAKGVASDLEVRFPVKAGPHKLGVFFADETLETEGPLLPKVADFRFLNKASSGRSKAVRLEDVLPAVGAVTIAGPYQPAGAGDTPSRRKILVCTPASSADEEPCARRILTSLARSAYRRPLTATDVQALMRLYDSGRPGSGFEAGIATAIEGILVSPAFLFRAEPDPANLPPGTVYQVSDLDLASRLSFFLWSSIPDDRLLDLAAHGKLRAPGVLEQQVRRMLSDSRAQALIDNFAGQWLYLRNLAGVHPDPEAFPDFDDSLRDAFEKEANLFLGNNLHEDRSVLNLLTADYTYVNERLARFYGIPNVYGSHFRRVPLVTPERRGLLGEGGILTVTSYANRTSPTIRGKWLLASLLGAPPPPPPPNVPSLKEDPSENGKVLTMRQRMEEHRKNPVCASCHAQMDPLGFALENFNGIGEWRTHEGTTPIDASASLPDGSKFAGPAGLRAFLLDHPDRFASTIAEKLLEYAIGRGVEYYDAPAIRKIVHDAVPDNYRWSSLILGVVRSAPFQMRMTRGGDLPLKTASLNHGTEGAKK
ncbi:MAG TPA: DUF1592 domain-containing protein [Bryobacteraceae bacterium]|jgi:mono/diheme cytochrome c family protein|nr:DUF1592 domain-containing protein [Bryobacteraceae bacterium]